MMMHSGPEEGRRLREERIRLREEGPRRLTESLLQKIAAEMERIGAGKFELRIPDPYFWSDAPERCTIRKRGEDFEIHLQRGYVDDMTVSAGGEIRSAVRSQKPWGSEVTRQTQSEFLGDNNRLNGLLEHFLNRVRTQKRAAPPLGFTRGCNRN